MVDPLIQYNRMPPPLDPESSTAHLDGELSRLERTTSQVIQRVTDIPNVYETIVNVQSAFDTATAYTDSEIATEKADREAGDAANSSALTTGLATKANVSHTHAESDVTGLVADLASKEPAIAAGTSGQYWRGDKTWQNLEPSRVRSVVKSADTANSSTTALADDTHLTLPVEANTTYIVEATLFHTAGGGGLAVALAGPSGATGLVQNDAAVGTTADPAAQPLGSTLGPIGGSGSTSGTRAAGIRAYISVGSTAGNVTVQWTRGTATGTTTLKTGSWLKVTKVGT